MPPPTSSIHSLTAISRALALRKIAQAQAFDLLNLVCVQCWRRADRLSKDETLLFYRALGQDDRRYRSDDYSRFYLKLIAPSLSHFCNVLMAAYYHTLRMLSSLV